MTYLDKDEIEKLDGILKELDKYESSLKKEWELNLIKPEHGLGVQHYNAIMKGEKVSFDAGFELILSNVYEHSDKTEWKKFEAIYYDDIATKVVDIKMLRDVLEGMKKAKTEKEFLPKKEEERLLGCLQTIEKRRGDYPSFISKLLDWLDKVTGGKLGKVRGREMSKRIDSFFTVDDKKDTVKSTKASQHAGSDAQVQHGPGGKK